MHESLYLNPLFVLDSSNPFVYLKREREPAIPLIRPFLISFGLHMENIDRSAVDIQKTTSFLFLSKSNSYL